MHTYSTDNDSRPTITALLGGVASPLVFLSTRLTSQLASVIPGVSGGIISWGVVFTLLWIVYSRYGWKTRMARLVGASKAPDFSGDWNGYIKTSYSGEIDDDALHESHDPEQEQYRVAAELHIDQTWRKINIHLATSKSESDSTGATILTQEGRWPSLTYQYENEPEMTSEDSMRAHDGTADLSLKQNDEVDVLEGFYYTGPNRENHGEMYFERES